MLDDPVCAGDTAMNIIHHPLSGGASYEVISSRSQQSRAVAVLLFNIITTTICFQKHLGARTENCKYSQS